MTNHAIVIVWLWPWQKKLATSIQLFLHLFQIVDVFSKAWPRRQCRFTWSATFTVNLQFHSNVVENASTRYSVFLVDIDWTKYLAVHRGVVHCIFHNDQFYFTNNCCFCCHSFLRWFNAIILISIVLIPLWPITFLDNTNQLWSNTIAAKRKLHFRHGIIRSQSSSWQPQFVYIRLHFIWFY